MTELKDRIDHVVIIVKENHTFDNYFGRFPGANGVCLDPAKDPPSGELDNGHGTWEQRANEQRYRVQYTENDIPAYFALARQYTLCDNYFSEVAGPSTPNHLMLICADSPVINNPGNDYFYDLCSLPIALERARITWGNYGGYVFEKYIKELAGHPCNHKSDLFAEDAVCCRLPTVSWIYADDGRSEEHPPQNLTEGMRWTVDQIQAIVDGGFWSRTAIFVTWDDWGGWFDHVESRCVEQWDTSKVQRKEDSFPEFSGQQFRYGSRVPCLVISPYAKPYNISKTERSHITWLNSSKPSLESSRSTRV
ncbi:MAG: alkaline phosphatase family protein [Chthoniobacterales bacterium]